ncbi:MAG TPA: winged helix-turn-helix domain-containing protein [Candidatus Sulfotelmatobacter sp.]|nr:winged helix-turn-helix domain-containing protein [Candidatus Sulfotelmatobacter sp.]
MESTVRNHRTRFGAFEVDLRSGEIYKHGIRLKLQDQPFQVLAVLLEHPGDVVTREELRQKLWSADTFVDFDAGLNSAIKKLRDVLADSTEQPRYIETLPRRGYRFIAQVENGDLPATVPIEKLLATVPPVVSKPELSNKRRIFMAAGIAVLLIVAALVTTLWLQSRDYFWRNPVAGARVQRITDWDGAAQAAALSRDGQFIAFLSDREGRVDVWITQVGSGQFHNLTNGSAPELINPAVRLLGFSPDGSLVTFWARKQDKSGGTSIGIWAVPTLGGQPRPYLEGAAELDWSRDGSRVAYHTTDPGDPLFTSNGIRSPHDRPIFAAPAGLHCHFPVWAPDSAFIYFAKGAPPDKLDAWRIPSSGGNPEQITSQGGVTYPLLLNKRTLLYLAIDADGSGPWLYGMDVVHRIPHQLTFAPDRYTSLSASADGRRLTLTLASPKTTLWRMRVPEARAQASAPTRIVLSTSSARSPRLGPDFLLDVSSSGAAESIWKLTDAGSQELWRGAGTQIIGAPAISPDGHGVAFAALQEGHKRLYIMRSDGSNTHIVTDSLDLQGSPAWTPDGASITTAANEHGVPHLYKVPVAGGAPQLFLLDYSLDPAWSVDDRFVLYSERDIGTTFSVKAVTAEGTAYHFAPLTLTRGVRHLRLLRDERSLVILDGEIQHKNLWLVDLETGAKRQLTYLPAGFDVLDFDISPDGREVVLERVEQRSDVVLLDLPRS